MADEGAGCCEKSVSRGVGGVEGVAGGIMTMVCGELVRSLLESGTGLLILMVCDPLWDRLVLLISVSMISL